MKIISVIFLFVINFQNIFTQEFGFDKLSHDFEDIYSGNPRVVDLTFRNTTNKTVYILNAKADRRFKILYSTKTIKPDSIAKIRIKFNPTEKGKFKEDIPIYVSSSFDPFVFTIKGNVKEIDNSMGLDCPSFNQKDVKNEQSFVFTVTVLDKETMEPIEKANVLMIQNGVVQESLFTNKRGMVVKKVPLGFYYFVATAEGYYTKEFPRYVNRHKDSVLILLQRSEPIIEEPIVVEPPVIKDTVVVEELPIEVEKDTLIVEKPTAPTRKDTLIPAKDIAEVGLPIQKYKPNNIVFLLDISSSMRAEGKLDLLKASMIELAKVLRDVDKVTIVGYSTFANEIMEVTTGENKEEIIAKIQSLKAHGLTAGGEGMKLAYRRALQHYIDGANNQIIMATDGDFNRGTTDVDKIVKKYTEQGVKISVIGVRNKPEHEKDMREVSKLGKGNYIHIKNYEDAKGALIEEIKKNALR